jgi:hypothetical protein
MSIEQNQPFPEPVQSKYEELVWRLGFLATKGPEPDQEPTNDQILDWYKRLPAHPIPLSYTLPGNEPKTLNQHFSQLFPTQTSQFGPACLEVAQGDNAGQFQTTPLCLNHDAFGSFLSDPGLGLDVVYYEVEMQFYYYEPFLNVYKPVSSEKLQNLYRGLLMRSANILKNTNAKLNIWAEFRSDKNARLVVLRAKSLLAADSSFFSPTSPHSRIKGQELIERVARVFVDQLLAREPGQILRLHEAYTTFLGLLRERNLPAIKRAEFKNVVGPLIREQFNVALRNDLPALNGEGLRGWKNVRLVQFVPA